MRKRAWEMELERLLSEEKVDPFIEKQSHNNIEKVDQINPEQNVIISSTTSLDDSLIQDRLEILENRYAKVESRLGKSGNSTDTQSHYLKSFENKIRTLNAWKTQATSIIEKLRDESFYYSEKFKDVEISLESQVDISMVQESIEDAISQLESRVNTELLSQSQSVNTIMEHVEQLIEQTRNNASTITDAQIFVRRANLDTIVAELKRDIHEIDKTLLWKLMEETRNLDRRISDSQQMIVNFVSGQSFATAASKPRESIAIGDGGEAAERIIAREVLPRISALESNPSQSVRIESILEDVEFQDYVSSAVKTYVDATSSEWESKLKTMGIQVTSLESKLSKMTLERDQLEKRLEQSIKDELAANTNIMKLQQKIAWLVAEVETLGKSQKEQSASISNVDSALRARFDEYAKTWDSRIQKPVQDLASLRARDASTNSKLDTIMERLERLTTDIENSSKKAEKIQKDTEERMSGFERVLSSRAEVQNRADRELANARDRVMPKVVNRSNSAGSMPEAVTMSAPSPRSSTPPPSVEATGGAGASTSRPPTPTSGGSQGKNAGTKTLEQLEREAKRKEELAAVRKRLEQFEKKWRENQKPAPTPTATSTRPSDVAQPQLKPVAPRIPPPPTINTSSETETAILIKKESDSESEDTSPVQPSSGGSKNDIPPNTRVRVPPQQSTPAATTTITCQYCSRTLPGKNTAALHEKVCDKRPANCKTCRKTFTVQELRLHESQCTAASVETSNCRYCDIAVETTKLEEHESTCDWVPSACTHCGMVIIRRDAAKHESVCSQKNSNANQKLQTLLQFQSSLREQPYEDWDCPEVVEWLRTIDGLNDSCIGKFQSFGVDGTMLAEIEVKDLEDEIGIDSAVDRTLIMNALAKLSNSFN